MDNNIKWEEIITTSPYNVLGLPSDKEVDLSNPQTSSEIYEVSNPRQLNKMSLEINEPETNYYDPTKKMVDNYLKTNISMYDNRGKYFDTYLFNQKFDQYIKEKTAERELKEKVKIYDLDRIENIQIQPYELPLNKLLINFKNIWFELFDNIVQHKDPTELLTTSNFFYFGISFVVIFLLYIMLSYIFE